MCPQHPLAWEPPIRGRPVQPRCCPCGDHASRPECQRALGLSAPQPPPLPRCPPPQAPSFAHHLCAEDTCIYSSRLKYQLPTGSPLGCLTASLILARMELSPLPIPFLLATLSILPVAQVKELGYFLSLLSSPMPPPICQRILTTPYSKCTLNPVTPSKATTLAPETIMVLL